MCDNIVGADASLEGECPTTESNQGQGGEREGGGKTGAGRAATRGGGEIEDLIEC